SDQATDPNNQEDRWDCIQGFYQLVNQDADGPQVAVRLLAHKIQSPQEKEALQALTVLEACMNNCGKRFHSEAGKFRFLNELIKILTPKYFGAWTSQKVKDRVTEVLYGWTLWLKDELKIQEAYSMLKKQGIVKKDPKLPDTVIMAPPPQRATDSIFDQDDKAKLLARLLKSARPEDLETANRLIKSTIKEEQEKAEKVSKRESTLKEVESSTKQLRELLDQNTLTGVLLQPSNDIKALYERCDRLRPSLFRLASDTMEDDAALAQILAANDELTLVVNAYKDQVGRGDPRHIKSYHLIDLSALDSPQTLRKAESPPVFEPSSPLFSHLESTFCSVADQDQNELGEPGYVVISSSLSLTLTNVFHIVMTWCCLITELDNVVPKQTEDNPKSYYEELLQVRLESKVEDKYLKVCLTIIFMCLVGQLEPITLHNRAGIHVSLHFAKDCPPGHPGVAVAVLSAVNTSALHVKDFMFQAAVPKTMLVKLQPASRTQLPPYKPLLPPPAVSQVILLANPHRRKVRLRYKLTLTHGDQQLNETGDVDNFPDWTSMVGF
uniref:Golgi associated, gamma adaptin ear containing, ARF binding protein 2 n=1 Tax=Amphiprion ocellaris TaxID=80972 RepID=A0AAQ5ZJI1_AMPOC